MPLFLYHLTLADEFKNPDTWSEGIHSTIEKHRIFLEALGKEGNLIFAGRTNLPFDDAGLFGLAVLHADSKEEAEELLKDDPAVRSHIQKAAIYPFKLALKFFENYNPGG